MGEQRKILIAGATSAIGVAIVHQLAQLERSTQFVLLAKNLSELKLQLSGLNASIEMQQYDLENPVELATQNITHYIQLIGWLPKDNSETEKTFLLNYAGVKKMTEQIIAQNKESLQQIIITGSVAGVKIREQNKDYGNAKAALHQYAKQLQAQYKTFTTTLVIPGYIDTKMLDGKKTPAFLTISPTALAKKYIDWIQSKPAIVYSQPIWQLISLVLKCIPEFVFKLIKI
jgi:decaprenylphospho-beta-D-erythro-pentofuranosid-2-ulose 2-reductase